MQKVDIELYWGVYRFEGGGMVHFCPSLYHNYGIPHEHHSWRLCSWHLLRRTVVVESGQGAASGSTRPSGALHSLASDQRDDHVSRESNRKLYNVLAIW